MEQVKALVCRQCGNRFEFTSSQQEFYLERGFQNGPRRCGTCTMVKRALEVQEKPKKEMFEAVCAECGGAAQLPFRPKGDRPVYCSACLLKRKKAHAE